MGKMTQIGCEIAKNMNGPSQSDVDARAWLSADYVRPKQKNTCAWVNNPTQQRKGQTMEALREEKQLRFLSVDEQATGRTRIAVRGFFTTRGVKMNVCVCVWVRTDSPATPAPKIINCFNHQQ